MVKFDILKPLRGKNLKKKIGWYNSEKHLCGKFGRLKRPCEDEGKNALVWWKVKKIFRFKIRKNPKKYKKEKIQKKSKWKKKKSSFTLVLDKMCVFCLYPILDYQQYVKRGSCRRPILSGLFCSFKYQKYVNCRFALIIFVPYLSLNVMLCRIVPCSLVLILFTSSVFLFELIVPFNRWYFILVVSLN